jgi:hypothetical protein
MANERRVSGPQISGDSLTVVLMAARPEYEVEIVSNHFIAAVTKDLLGSSVEKYDRMILVDGNKSLIGVFNRGLEDSQFVEFVVVHGEFVLSGLHRPLRWIIFL